MTMLSTQTVASVNDHLADTAELGYLTKSLVSISAFRQNSRRS